MSSFACFLIGAGVMLLLWIAYDLLVRPNREEKPKRPEPTLTEDTRRIIREEIKSDNDAALVRRIFDKLDRGK